MCLLRDPDGSPWQEQAPHPAVPSGYTAADGPGQWDALHPR
ncbi:hypothetical protein EBESD8_17400 [Rhodococcus aetherivorans]|nr:hypothetical protein EBESD8_17400 [Rhodococcus aetherivorans]